MASSDIHGNKTGCNTRLVAALQIRLGRLIQPAKKRLLPQDRAKAASEVVHERTPRKGALAGGKHEETAAVNFEADSSCIK